MMTKLCPVCNESMPEDCFRAKAKACVWCVFSPMSKRAAARFRDKRKVAKNRLNISEADFVAWYQAQEDCCAYCGLTFAELKRLRIKRGGGFSVSWDVDRIDSSRPYEPDNLALSCFVCNMAKGDILSAAEARIIGQAVQSVWRARLSSSSGA